MKQEGKEFHKKVMICIHIETFLSLSLYVYIYETWEITSKSDKKKRGLYKVSKQ